MSAYISVVDAAKLSKYNPDYITQLCRSGALSCVSISSVWFVSLESLKKYLNQRGKKIVDSETCLLVEPASINNNQSFLINGEEYCSTDYAAKISDYNRDYITQLARSGNIRAVKISKVWFVSKDDILNLLSGAKTRSHKSSVNLHNNPSSKQAAQQFDYETLDNTEDIPRLNEKSANKIKIKRVNHEKKTRIDNTLILNNASDGSNNTDSLTQGNKKHKSNAKVKLNIKNVYDKNKQKAINASGVSQSKNKHKEKQRLTKQEFVKEVNLNIVQADSKVEYSFQDSEAKLTFLHILSYILILLSVLTIVYLNLLLFNIMEIPFRALF